MGAISLGDERCMRTILSSAPAEGRLGVLVAYCAPDLGIRFYQRECLVLHKL